MRIYFSVSLVLWFSNSTFIHMILKVKIDIGMYYVKLGVLSFNDLVKVTKEEEEEEEE